MDKVRIGFIGCGSHSTENLYPCLRYMTDKAELVAVCDLNSDLAKRNAKWFGFEKWYTDVEDLLKRERLDAVFIVGPPRMQTSLGTMCLQAGVHIFVEKPPAISAREAENLMDTSREAGRFVMVGFMKRFAVGYRLAKQITQQPEFGEVVHIVTKFANGPYGSIWGIPSPSKSYLIGQAVHHFDLARYFMGEVTSVYAKLFELADKKFSFSVLPTFERERTGVMNLNSCQSWAKIDEYVEITGDEAFIFVDDMATHVRYYPKWDWIAPEGFTAANLGNFWEVHHLPSRWNQSRYLRGYYGEVEHFIDSVLRKERPKPDITDGYKALKIAEAVWESANTGKTVELYYARN